MDEHVDSSAVKAADEASYGTQPLAGPASIAIFQYDQAAFCLKAPVIISLSGESFTLQSTSELWKNSMLTSDDQDLPTASIHFVKNDLNGHTVTCPDGRGELQINVNNNQLASLEVAEGFSLAGGELVKVYCNQWLRNGQVVYERLGPFTFQYRAAGQVEQKPQAALAEKNLEQLPAGILRQIFGELPVDEVLYNIPAVCSKFFELVKEKVAFNRWKISHGWLTPQEAVFCQGWTANPVTSLVLGKVLIKHGRDQHSFDQFLWNDMEPRKSSVTSLEITFETSPTIPEDAQLELDKTFYLTFGEKLATFTALKSLKVDGFPVKGYSEIVTKPMPTLEKLWVRLRGKLTGGDDREDYHRHMFLPNLEQITFKFCLENQVMRPWQLELIVHVLSQQNRELLFMERAMVESLEAIHEGQLFGEAPPTTVEVPPWPPCNFRRIFDTYAPLTPSSYATRALILDAKGDSWKTCESLLTALPWLEALSLTIDAAMTTSEMKLLINSFPRYLEVLKLAAPMAPFDDKLCVVLADNCPSLELFWCQNSAGMTRRGMKILLDVFEKMEGVALLREQDGVWVPWLELAAATFGDVDYVDYVRCVEEELQEYFD